MTNRACFLSLLLALPFTVARAESQPPEIVRIVGKVRDLNGLNQVTMESDTGHYVLLCNRKAAMRA